MKIRYSVIDETKPTRKLDYTCASDYYYYDTIYNIFNRKTRTCGKNGVLLSPVCDGKYFVNSSVTKNFLKLLERVYKYNYTTDDRLLILKRRETDDKTGEVSSIYYVRILSQAEYKVLLKYVDKPMYVGALLEYLSFYKFTIVNEVLLLIMGRNPVMPDEYFENKNKF